MNQKTILKKSDKIRIFLNSPFVLILSILLSIGILMNMIHIFVLNNQLFIDLLGIIFPILFCIGIWLSYFQNDTTYNPKGLKLLKVVTTLKLFITMITVILVLFVLLPIVYLSINIDSSVFILSSILFFIVLFAKTNSSAPTTIIKTDINGYMSFLLSNSDLLG